MANYTTHARPNTSSPSRWGGPPQSPTAETRTLFAQPHGTPWQAR